MSRTALLLCALATGSLALVLAAGLVVMNWSPYPQRHIGGAFELVDALGHRVTQADLRGRPTALYFGYTYCPDVCPTTLLLLTNVMAKMGGTADRLNVAFVTVDPERDTPEQMRLYLSSFDPRIRGFTGTTEQVAAMARAYHVFYRRVPGDKGDYTMDHSSYVMLFDRSGGIAGVVNYGDDERDVLAKLTALAEPGACHPGLPTPSTLWGTSSSGALCKTT
jgi:protein SCO1/2